MHPFGTLSKRYYSNQIHTKFFLPSLIVKFVLISLFIYFLPHISSDSSWNFIILLFIIWIIHIVTIIIVFLNIFQRVNVCIVQIIIMHIVKNGIIMKIIPKQYLVILNHLIILARIQHIHYTDYTNTNCDNSDVHQRLYSIYSGAD